MSEHLFSMCKRIVGKDKTQVVIEDATKGTTRTMERWATFKNRFTNQALLATSTDADGNVRFGEVTRSDVIKLIAHHGYATAYILKDDTLKKGRSRGDNTLGARVLMVDFDNTWSIEDAMQHPWWSKVWFAYTTPSFGGIQKPLEDDEAVKLPANQLEALQSQVGLPKRNFRLVFRLHRFITKEELVEVMAGLMDVFPQADRSCIDDARIFFGTVRGRVEHPTAEYRLTEADIKDLKGRAAGWREAHGRETKARIAKVASTAANADGVFDGDTEFTLDDGSRWTAKELLESKPLGWKQGCFSIFRPERNPSAFVIRWADTGNLFTYDSGSELKHTWVAARDEGLTLRLKPKKQVETPAEIAEEDREQVTLVHVTPKTRSSGYQPNYTRTLTVEERRAQIKQTVDALARFNIFFAPEGFGKSYVTLALTSRMRRVLFCCATNEQAEQKAQEFRQRVPQGFAHLWKPKVQLCVSRDYLFKKATGVAVVKKDSIDPFEPPVADKVETIEALVKHFGCTVTQAHEMWVQEYDNAPIEEPDFSTHELSEHNVQIIVTTMARAEILARSAKYRAMDESWVVVYDDPGFADVSNLIPFSEQRETRILKENERRESQGLPHLVIEKRTFDDRIYYVRPVEKRLGLNFHPFKREESDAHTTIPVVFTTTEELTRFLLESNAKDVNVFDYMHEIEGCNVTVWGTSMVHKKNDGLLILAAELLRRDFPEETISLIADGLGQKLNHINNKGQNTLSTQHIIIELSQLHPSRRTQLVDEVSYANPHTKLTDRQVQGVYMRDQMHQAIGRNSGYRQKDGDFQTVVLCDPHYWQSLYETSRYSPTPWSYQLDASEGESIRSAVYQRQRQRELLNFYGEMPPMLQSLQMMITAPNRVFNHPELVSALISTISTSRAIKPRILEAITTQISANKKQNDLLEKLLQTVNAL